MTYAGPPDPADGRSAGDDVVHRGIRWQRASSGALRWWSTDGADWVVYHPGDDSPPRPPEWESRRRGWGLIGTRPTLDRPPWRSPYRVVPLLVMVVLLAVALLQAGHGTAGQDAAEARAANALVGRCLPRVGTVGGVPRYGAKGVACSDPVASVEVTRVLPGVPGSPSCPPGTVSVQLAYAGVRHPHQLCVVPAPAG